MGFCLAVAGMQCSLAACSVRNDEMATKACLAALARLDTLLLKGMADGCMETC